MKKVVASVDGNGFAEGATACEIDQWQWRWVENEFLAGGGALEIQGELKDGHAGATISVIAYKSKNGARGDLIGHDFDYVGVLGEFRVTIASPEPRRRTMGKGQIHIRYGCEKD